MPDVKTVRYGKIACLHKRHVQFPYTQKFQILTLEITESLPISQRISQSKFTNQITFEQIRTITS
jgi:hypothetical protein